jgi:uncharacterized protein YbaR (Trm112 family)
VEIVACPRCSQRLLVPDDRGRITVTCGKCSHHFSHSGSARTSSSTAAVAPTPRSSVSRRLLWLGPLIFGIATAAGSAVYNAVQESRRPPISSFNGYLAPPVGVPQARMPNEPSGYSQAEPTSGPRRMRCPGCFGGGKCYLCGGDGRDTKRNGLGYYGDCEACKGDGVCPVCHGRGYLVESPGGTPLSEMPRIGGGQNDYLPSQVPDYNGLLNQQ